MTSVRELMTEGCECAQEGDTLEAAARKMRDLDVGALPICGDDRKLHGMITDRDIVVKCIATGGNPQTMAVRDLEQHRIYWVDAKATLQDALRVMAEHQVRRLPVLENHKLVGMLSQADVARFGKDAATGHLVDVISKPM